MALLQDGGLWVWGRYAVDIAGTGVTPGGRSEIHTPVQILDNVAAIASQPWLKRVDGSIWAWGNIGFGNGGSISEDTPIMISNSLVWYNEDENIIMTDYGFIHWIPLPDLLDE